MKALCFFGLFILINTALLAQDSKKLSLQAWIKQKGYIRLATKVNYLKAYCLIMQQLKIFSSKIIYTIIAFLILPLLIPQQSISVKMKTLSI
ncbi:MAG: hypothetical protein V4553_08400 [Bacteroidota bacterium]